LVCLVRAIHGRRFGAWRFVPLLFLAASLAIARWGNLEGMATRWNFDAHMQARLEVIEMVSKAELPAESKGPCDCFYARLPPRLAYLSSAGIVSIARYNQEFSVTFYVRRVGMFPDDDYTAFIYRSGAGVPETGVEDTDHFMAVDRWAPHWFFVVHT
jgi:hypothetical protein